MTGTLELLQSSAAGARTHRLHLVQGLLADIEAGSLPVPRLGELLVARGLLNAAAARELALREPPEPVAEWLSRRHCVAVAALQAALREQRALRLEALYAVDEAALRFRPPRPERRRLRVPPLTPREFLHGRPRKRARGSRGLESARPIAAQRAYDLLGLTPPADPEQLRQAFRRLALGCHPDRFGSASPSEQARMRERFARLSAAYHLLMG